MRLTIVSAVNPYRYRDSYTELFLKVWFEELSEPVPFLATPFDIERHGKELWIRTMRGDFGEIEVIDKDTPTLPDPKFVLAANDPPKMLEYHGKS